MSCSLGQALMCSPGTQEWTVQLQLEYSSSVLIWAFSACDRLMSPSLLLLAPVYRWGKWENRIKLLTHTQKCRAGIWNWTTWAQSFKEEGRMEEWDIRWGPFSRVLKLKLQYFGHLMWSTDSFEKTLMLGKIEGRRRRRQKMRRLDGITNSMDMGLGGLQELVTDRKAWHAVVHGVTQCRTWLNDWIELNCWIGLTQAATGKCSYYLLLPVI